jgi:hypothetical protein
MHINLSQLPDEHVHAGDPFLQALSSSLQHCNVPALPILAEPQGAAWNYI